VKYKVQGKKKEEELKKKTREQQKRNTIEFQPQNQDRCSSKERKKE